MIYFSNVSLAFKKAFSIKGRTTLSQFYCFFSTILISIGILFYLSIKYETNPSIGVLFYPFIFYLIISFIPFITISIRRLHDNDFSGWGMLLLFIPIANAYVLWLIFCSRDILDNKYGPYDKNQTNMHIQTRTHRLLGLDKLED